MQATVYLAMNAAETATDPVALTALHEILSALAQDDAPEQVFAQTTEKVTLLTGASSALIALLDNSRDYLTFAAANGDGTKDILGTRVHASDSLMGNTARTGESRFLFRPDKSGESAFGDPFSAAVVPLFAGGVPVGALAALNKTDRRPFDGADLLALSTLAKAASVALVGAKRRDDSRRQSRELGILYEAVRGIAGHLSVQEVVQAVVTQTAAHLENSAVVVFLFNDERTGLFVAEEIGLTQEQQEHILPVTHPAAQAILSASRPAFLSFIAKEDDLSPTLSLNRSFEPLLPDLSARSAIGATFRSGDTTHGIILVLSNQPPGAYTLADANLLSVLASQTANALDNALLYEDATRRAEEATTLYELSQAITSTLQGETVPERVADAVLSLLAIDKFALFLHDEVSDKLRLLSSRGISEEAASGMTFAVGEGIPGWVMEFETPTAVPDVAYDHRNTGTSMPLQNAGIVSLACMPLQAGERTIGVLCAMTGRRRLFTIAEMELLYTVANQAAVALENSRIYADVREKGRELRKYFHRVARALGSAQSPRAVPHLIVTLTLEVMGGDRCALYAVREDNTGERQLELVARHGFRLSHEPEGAGSTNPSENAPVLIPTADDNPAGWVARRARSLVVEDLNEEGRFDRNYVRPARGKATSLIAVPLRSGNRVIGVLELYTRLPRRWRGDELRLLLTFASQATVAFQSARLADERESAALEADNLRKTLEGLRGG